MNSKAKILIIEDDNSMRDFLKDFLEHEGYSVQAAINGREGLEIIKKEYFDLVITDVVMPEVDGVEVLRSIKGSNIETSIIVITGQASIRQAVEFIKMGADDYFKKPFITDEILLVIERCIRQRKLANENTELRHRLGRRHEFPEIIGGSEKMQVILDLILKVADSDATVLILGESGTGKELVARAIHEKGLRKSHPFIPVNCGAIPETLLESELFGYEKGSFTGADVQKQGFFEAADKGTIFLDEIGEMGQSLQVKLLRILETRMLYRIGSNKGKEINVRVIAATNKNLKEEVQKKEFRQDLFYRFNVFPIVLPSLRERREDIPLLVNWFLEKHKYKGKKVSIASEALKLLTNTLYSWPGNVRELENVIARATILSLGKEITVDLLPPEIRTPDVSKLYYGEIYEKPFKEAKQAFERRYVEKLLQKTENDFNIASQFAGLSRAYLYEMVKKYDIDSGRRKKDIKNILLSKDTMPTIS
ncbi:MAG TPA: sigma-54-dependent transcriptional regulator [Candidatus Brocadiia bacterium]|nr:sigma-54 dependent transcriptional regulator [Candidatus Brocadiales bacterium]